MNKRRPRARPHSPAERGAQWQCGIGGRHAIIRFGGYRGVPCAGYMPIRTEIDHCPLWQRRRAWTRGVPVIVKEASPLLFSRWEPDCALVDGPLGRGS